MAAFNVLLVVGGDEKRGPRAPVERGPEPVECLVIEGAGRLVKEKQGRIAEQSAREGELLDHPGRAAIDSLGEDALELELLGQARDVAARLPGAVPADTREEEEVLTAREPQVKGPLLRKRRADQAPSLQSPSSVVTDPNPSRCRRERSGDAPENRRLAGTVRPAQRDALARGDGQVERSHDLAIAEAAAELFDLQDLLVQRGLALRPWMLDERLLPAGVRSSRSSPLMFVNRLCSSVSP
jgi:hypothetical protein